MDERLGVAICNDGVVSADYTEAKCVTLSVLK